MKHKEGQGCNHSGELKRHRHGGASAEQRSETRLAVAAPRRRRRETEIKSVTLSTSVVDSLVFLYVSLFGKLT